MQNMLRKLSAALPASAAGVALILTTVLPVQADPDRPQAAPPVHHHEPMHGSPLPLPPQAQFKLNQCGVEVATLRRLLDKAGFPSAPAKKTDCYDLGLLKSVRAYQVSKRLKSTGIPRLETIAKLNAVARSAPQAVGEKAASTVGADLRPAPGSTGSLGRVNTDHQPGSETPELPMLDSHSVERLEAAISHYGRMLTDKSLVRVPPPAKAPLSHIKPLVARLTAEKLLANHPLGADAEAAVGQALKHWQMLYGLRSTGTLDAATRAAVNVSISVRLQQLKATLERANALRGRLDPFYVIVNAAAARGQIVDHDRTVATMPVIVGRGSRRTPEFVSTIPDIQLSPTWTLPPTIIRKDVAPLVLKNARYLDEHHMRAMVGNRVVDPATINWRRGPFPRIVQRPGDDNPLGAARFGMARGGAYYIHGTSRPELLKGRLDNRFLSSGCVRVADPFALGAVLLRHADNPEWSVDKLLERARKHEDGWSPGERILFKKPVQVIVTYFSAWVTGDGAVHFRRDVYHRDKEPALWASRLASK